MGVFTVKYNTEASSKVRRFFIFGLNKDEAIRNARKALRRMGKKAKLISVEGDTVCLS